MSTQKYEKQINYILSKVKESVKRGKNNTAMLTLAENELTDQLFERNSFNSDLCKSMANRRSNLLKKGWIIYGLPDSHSITEAEPPKTEENPEPIKEKVRLCLLNCCNYAHSSKDLRTGICLLNRYGCCEKKSYECRYDHRSTEVSSELMLKSELISDEKDEKVCKIFFYLHSIRIFHYPTQQTIVIQIQDDCFTETKHYTKEMINNCINSFITYVSYYNSFFYLFNKYEFNSISEFNTHIQDCIYHIFSIKNMEEVKIEYSNLYIEKNRDKSSVQIMLHLPSTNYKSAFCVKNSYQYNELFYSDILYDYKCLILKSISNNTDYLQCFDQLSFHLCNTSINNIISYINDPELFKLKVESVIPLFVKHIQSNNSVISTFATYVEPKIENILPSISNDEVDRPLSPIHSSLPECESKDNQVKNKDKLYDNIPITENVTLKCIKTIKETSNKLINDVKNLLKFY